MTPTQHILSTVVLLTLSACGESNSSSEEGSSSTATETVKAVESQPTEAEPSTTKSPAEIDPVAPPEPRKEPEPVTQTLVKTQTSVQTQTKKKVKKKKTPSELDPANFLSTRLEKDIVETGFAIQGSESSTRYPGRYCINVGEGASCPTVSDMRKRMPDIQGCSPYKYVEITSEAVRQDLRIFHGPYPPPNPPEAGDACCYQAEYVRVKAPCVYGRPLMHKGEAQRAQSVEREDWNQNIRIEVHNSGDEKAQAGAFYRQTALFEHASIASFHKFALELIQFGAPPSLLTKVQSAIRDEIEHAQMAFGIASELLGTSVGPHTMSIQPQLAQSLRELAVSTFTEGAVGESIAVVLAATQRAKATEPAICAFLERVIADESKHAELAWETLRWCLKQDPSIAEALESIDLNEVVAPYRLSHFTAIPSLGILRGSEHTRAVLQGLQNVVQPSLSALLGAFH